MSRELTVKLVRAFYNGNFNDIQSYGARGEILAALGFDTECDDGVTPLSEFFKRALKREKPDYEILTVLKEGCRECTSKKVPCEVVCPVNAISKNSHAKIDFDICISCGRCVGSCDFGAIHEKSQVIDILNKIKQGKKVVALVAPSIAGQFPYSMGRLKNALRKIGFYDVLEVAYGADITARNEAKELAKRVNNHSFMTTSCCNAYMELVRRHIPEMMPFVTSTKSPGHYIGAISRERCEDCVNVFVAPCTTKRKEGILDPYLDYVLNFLEVDDILAALEIDIGQCEDEDFELKSSIEGRNFPMSGSVAHAVSVAMKCPDCKVVPHLINGLNKISIQSLKDFAKSGKCEFGNLIEVMACPSGCLGGNANLMPANIAREKIMEYASESFSLGE